MLSFFQRFGGFLDAYRIGVRDDTLTVHSHFSEWVLHTVLPDTVCIKYAESETINIEREASQSTFTFHVFTFYALPLTDNNCRMVSMAWWAEKGLLR